MTTRERKMREAILSKLEFVAIGLVHEANLFQKEDIAHLNHVSMLLELTTIEEPALIATVNVFFFRWSYLDHKKSNHPANAMPAEVRVVFMQDANRKLTGEVECGFIAEEPRLKKQLDYIRGW